MRAIIQRVTEAKVVVASQVIASIDAGMLILVGFAPEDTPETLTKFVRKICTLRIFQDQDNKMNLDIRGIAGEILLVPQFTLYADATRGNRPSFTQAAEPTHAKACFTQLCGLLQQEWAASQFGQFAANMQVSLVNAGPVTIPLFL